MILSAEKTLVTHIDEGFLPAQLRDCSDFVIVSVQISPAPTLVRPQLVKADPEALRRVR
jgi:hypothetical protein